MRVVSILVFLAAVAAGQSDDVLSIDVNTGEQTIERSASPEAPPVTAGGDRATTVLDAPGAGAVSTTVAESKAPASPGLPEGPLDLGGVKVILGEGEDPTEDMSPGELIIRSLLRIPASDQDRIGLTALMKESEREGRPVDEEKLREIWEARQAELQETADAMVDEAESLTYLIDVLRLAPSSENFKERVLDALEQLDYHLGDIDLAKDFHDVHGGWPALTAMLHPGLPSAIRAAAAVTIGTAVKNDQVYQSWLLEPWNSTGSRSGAATLPVMTLDQPTESLPTTATGLIALCRLMRDGVRLTTRDGEGGDDSGSASDIDAGDLLIRRGLYAASSAIRYNAATQAAFMKDGGITHLLELATSQTGVSWTIRAKISSLVSDLLAEAADLDTVDDDLGRGLRAMDWCKATVLSLDPKAPVRTQEKALQALSYQLEPNALACWLGSMSKEQLGERKSFLIHLTEQIEALRHRLNADEDMDSDYKNDIQVTASLCQQRASIQMQAGTRSPGGLA